MNAETTRTCNVCHEAKSLTKDFYRSVKRGVLQYGYTCKKCASARACANQAAKKAGKVRPEAGYPWEPISELDRIGLYPWGYITRKGQLRPIVTVELGEVA